MFERVKVYVVEIEARANYQLRWWDPITQKVRTKATKISRAGARARKAGR